MKRNKPETPNTTKVSSKKKVLTQGEKDRRKMILELGGFKNKNLLNVYETQKQEREGREILKNMITWDSTKALNKKGTVFKSLAPKSELKVY